MEGQKKCGDQTADRSKDAVQYVMKIHGSVVEHEMSSKPI